MVAGERIDTDRTCIYVLTYDVCDEYSSPSRNDRMGKDWSVKHEAQGIHVSHHERPQFPARGADSKGPVPRCGSLNSKLNFVACLTTWS